MAGETSSGPARSFSTVQSRGGAVRSEPLDHPCSIEPSVELLRFATLELWEATNAAHSDFGLPVLGAEGHFKPRRGESTIRKMRR